MPTALKRDPYKDQFLAGLPDDEYKNLRPYLQMVSVKIGEVLYWHGDPVGVLYFPPNASVSWVSTLHEGKCVELALIGSVTKSYSTN
jgi:hypothetical protein